MGDVELLLVRIDHFQDRAAYISELREWLQELQIANGRVVTMGDVQMLFVAASSAQNDRLVAFYRSRDIDTNSRGERCVDKFIDVLGRKMVQSSSCKGFLEMNVLNPTLLQKVLVDEWQVEKQWLDTALATTRTKTFLEWKEAAKAARKERRKKEGQVKQQEREVKKIKREQEAAQKAREDVEKADAEQAEEGDEEKPVGDVKPQKDFEQVTKETSSQKQGQKSKLEQKESEATKEAPPQKKQEPMQKGSEVTKETPPQKKQEQKRQQQQQKSGPKKKRRNNSGATVNRVEC